MKFFLKAKNRYAALPKQVFQHQNYRLPQANVLLRIADVAVGSKYVQPPNFSDGHEMTFLDDIANGLVRFIRVVSSRANPPVNC